MIFTNHLIIVNPLETRAVFLDISKTFDKVWLKGRIFKVKQNEVSGPVLNLLNNYLLNRKQRVVLNGFSSDFFPIEPGVPQGSVLGPLLFFIYINDLEANMKSKIKFFVDHIMVYSVIHDTVISADDLNHDLEKINKWAYQWKMALILIQISRQLRSYPPPPPQKKVQIIHLYFNGSTVSKVDVHKHLGLNLDSKLSFVSRINEKINKAKQLIGILKYLSQYLSLKTLGQMYKIFIRPHFDYCDVIYHTPHLTNPFESSITC